MCAAGAFEKMAFPHFAKLIVGPRVREVQINQRDAAHRRQYSYRVQYR